MVLRRSRKFSLYINTKDQNEQVLLKQNKIEVGLKEKKKLVDSLVDYNQFGSQVLLPLIIKILKKNEQVLSFGNKLNFSDIDGIEVEEGPGSYTGLKVGASVAQALGFALNIPVNGEINKPVKLRYT